MNTENKQLSEKLSEKELRRQIKGNLEIACDTWDMHNLLELERRANDMVLAGLYSHGLMYKGLVTLVNMMFDEKTGLLKLTSDPDDTNNAYRVLAEMLKENAPSEKEAEQKSETEKQEVVKSKQDYANFF